ncbi:Ig-like domain-containing protein [bacterium]|nr:Ig-like domain-containing protein [bacterium]
MKKSIFIIFILTILSFPYSDVPVIFNDELEKGDVLSRKLNKEDIYFKFHVGLYLNAEKEMKPTLNESHDVIDMLIFSNIDKPGEKTKGNNLFKFIEKAEDKVGDTFAYIYDTHTYKGRELSLEERNSICEISQSEEFVRMKYICGILNWKKARKNIIEWEDNNADQILQPNEVTGVRCDGWVELVYAKAKLALQTDSNGLSILQMKNPHLWFNQKTKDENGDDVTYFTPNTLMYAMKQSIGEAPSVEIKNSSDCEISDGEELKDLEITIHADDGENGSGLHSLEIWKGYPNEEDAEIVKTITGEYARGHTYSSEEIGALPVGEIYIRSFDQAGNYTDRNFVVKLPSVESTFPYDRSTNINRDLGSIEIRFNHEMNTNSVESAFWTDPGITGTSNWLDNNSRLEYTISYPLDYRQSYAVGIRGTAKDINGLILDGDKDGVEGGDFSFIFTVEDDSGGGGSSGGGQYGGGGTNNGQGGSGSSSNNEQPGKGEPNDPKDPDPSGDCNLLYYVMGLPHMTNVKPNESISPKIWLANGTYQDTILSVKSTVVHQSGGFKFTGFNGSIPLGGLGGASPTEFKFPMSISNLSDQEGRIEISMSITTECGTDEWSFSFYYSKEPEIPPDPPDENDIALLK